MIYLDEPKEDSDDEPPVKNQFVKTPAAPQAKHDSDSDFDDWPSDSESSSDSSDDDGKYTNMRERYDLFLTFCVINFYIWEVY